MEEYRRSARDTLSKFNFIPLMMEYFPAQARPPQQVIVQFLNDADAMILIAGASYGSMAKEARGYVEWELDQALVLGLPVVVLVLEEKARRQVRDVDPSDRLQQEAFITRLRSEGRIAKSFSAKSFGEELGSALAELPRHLDEDAGYVKAFDYRATLGTIRFLRMISSLALVRQGCLQMTTRKALPVERGADTRKSVQQVLEILHDEMSDHPVTIDLVSSLIGWFLERLHGLPSAAGFAPQSMEELRLVLDVLFGEGLVTLKATSIHSNRRELASYKGYWHDEGLGTFFQEKNKRFLSPSEGGHEIRRVYACDLLSDSVAESWFAKTVVEQVHNGALVKVVEINERKLSSYEDFGIYEHNTTPDTGAGYLLLAPADQNKSGDELRTLVTPEEKTVDKYRRKFDKMWEERDETLRIDTTPDLDEASDQPLGVHGVGSINELFDNCIILRKMTRLDTHEALLPEDAGFVRKYEPQYAKALADHIQASWPGTRHIVYVGDTYANDGAAIRNLQRLKLPVSGFICEPQLGLRRLWFNSTLYSDSWTDLVGFASNVKDHIGQHTLAIFDIDQTLWAPKGVHEKPLSRTRTQAMCSLVDSYVHDSDSDVAKRARERVLRLYDEISRVQYHKTLTMDNEDYKAAICVFLSLNLIWDAQEERGDPARGIEFFNRLAKLSTEDFVSYTRDNYLAPMINTGSGGGLGNITQLITQSMAAGTTDQYSNYGERHGISVPRVNEDVLAVFRAMTGPSTIKFEAFRLREFEEAHRRATSGLPLEDSIVLSKPTWDFACWLKDHGVNLLALSDRPDEATALGEQSLLDAEMTLYG
ncbi:MAG: DUF4062 domain-containing protein, partial [Actinomycetota bacterium]|nr:DUF4062 domain-containing protein [Actinomycetota bacterium]